jgi:hypothetical protein
MCILVSSIIIFSSIERLKRPSSTLPYNYSPFHRLPCTSYNITKSSHEFSTSSLPFSRIRFLIDASITRQRMLPRLMSTANRSNQNASCPSSAIYAIYVTMNPYSDSLLVTTSSSRSLRKLANCSCVSIRTNAQQTHTWSLRPTAGSVCST